MSAKEVLENKGVRLLYFAVLLVLVLSAVWHLKTMNEKATKTERMCGENLGLGLDGSVCSTDTSGADARFQSVQSGANMAGSTEPPSYNANVKALTGASERMSSRREYPAFWDYARDDGETMSARQFLCANGTVPDVGFNAETGQYNLRCADGSAPGLRAERMLGGRVALDVQDALLGASL